MTIAEALRAVDAEYTAECEQMKSNPAFDALVRGYMHGEFGDIDQELPLVVGDMAGTLGAPEGTVLPPQIYQIARMCFRLGMRAQRKLDHPEQATAIIWRTDERPV